MGIFGRKKKDGSKEEKKDRKTDDKKGGSSDPENSGEEKSERRAANINAAAAFSDALSKSAKSSNRILLISIGFFTLVLAGYGFMAFQMTSKVQGLNENMQVTVQKVEELNKIIESLSSSQGEFTNQQQILGQAVVDAESSVTELKNELPGAAAQQVSKETNKVVSQVISLSQIVAKQGKDISRASKTIEGLGAQLENFQNQLVEARKLNSDVQALVTLEKAKYLEVLERQADLQEMQKGPDPLEVPRDPNLIFYSIQSAENLN